MAQLTLPQQLAYMLDDDTSSGVKRFKTQDEWKRWEASRANA